MQILKTALFQLLIVVVLLLSPFALPAQDFATEGVSEFSVTYKPKNENVKARDLTRKYGNRYIVYWSRTQLKKMYMLNDDTLIVSRYNYPDTIRYARFMSDPYYYLRSLSPKSRQYEIIDTDIKVNNISCDVYKDSINNDIVYLIKDKPLKLSSVANFRDLVRWEIERDDYIIVKERVPHRFTYNKESVFNLDKEKIVYPHSFCTHCTTVDIALNRFTRDFYESNRFPRYFLIRGLEGKLSLSFIINQEGEPVNPKVRPVHFRYYSTIKPVTSQQKKDRITRRIQRRILRDYRNSIESVSFDAPMADGEPINIRISIPVGYFYYSR